ncbi:hypothetical protein BHS06_28140 [Myxococcus xanthus]|uniref:choice-of-anchor D domain-containing protein n=1 Tax=Myxococcus xanthus TaxID=34 RepID=UPI00112B9C5A|nr:choice-of-anchor D domain-containing protein [Myxococcus xanthus]QDE92536.1 hypothetical protein BHS06_28140 [Myxococcus xanthus]
MRMGLTGRGLTLALLVTIGTACHEGKETRAVQATAVVDTDLLDFGDVPVGEWREREVRIRNVGYVPFSALDALGLANNPSYEVELGEGAERVLPGESHVVHVRFHPLTEGLATETVHVKTDANQGAEAQVQATGVGTPTPIGVEPPFLDYETLEVDSERTLEVTVTNPVDLPLTLTVVGTHPDPFSADAITIPPLSSLKVSTRYLPRALGNMGARMEILSCEGCTPATVELKGNSVASAFVFDPAPVPFDLIPVHERTQSYTRARNVTWRPVTIERLVTSDHAFVPISRPEGSSVGPGEVVEMQMEFAARYSGPNVGDLTVHYTSDKARNSQVILDARGGRPTLAVTPVSLDFGEVPVGGKVERVIRISNAGTNGPLQFLGVAAGGDSPQFSVDVPTRGTEAYPWSGGVWPVLETTPGLPIAPGTDALELKVYFEPTAVGTWTAALRVRSDDLFNPEREIILTGRSRATAPCVYELTPQPVMDFGNVTPDRGAVLGFYFRNPGSAECAVKNIHISNDGGGVFFMPGGRLTGGVVPYDSGFSAMVAFRPRAEGDFTGELQLTVSSPTAPTVRLPLKGVSRQSCLVASPAFVDFGPIRYDCAAAPRKTYVANRCSSPVTVTGADIGHGTSSQFSLVMPMTAPVTLAPGAGFELEIGYARNVHGQHFSPLYVRTPNEPSPLLVPLLAETNHEGIQVDRYTQGTDSQLDVLFVVSNTTTMQQYQDRLKAAIPQWLQAAQTNGVDVRVGVTSTGLVARGPQCGGGANGGEAGRLFPVDGSRPRVVSGSSATAAADIQANLGVGMCHNLVQGLETMRQALSAPLSEHMDDPRTAQANDGNSGFVRAAARTAVVVLADEDDNSGFGPESYIQFLKTMKGTGMSHRSQLYGLVPTDAGCATAGSGSARFTAVAHGTGGQVANICGQNYDGLLEQVIQRAGEPQADFPLTATPTGLGEMAVRVQGQPVPATQWVYNAEQNAIVFQPGAIPLAGQSVEVRYRSVCAVP